MERCRAHFSSSYPSCLSWLINYGRHVDGHGAVENYGSLLNTISSNHDLPLIVQLYLKLLTFWSFMCPMRTSDTNKHTQCRIWEFASGPLNCQVMSAEYDLCLLWVIRDGSDDLRPTASKMLLLIGSGIIIYWSATSFHCWKLSKIVTCEQTEHEGFWATSYRSFRLRSDFSFMASLCQSTIGTLGHV